MYCIGVDVEKMSYRNFNLQAHDAHSRIRDDVRHDEATGRRRWGGRKGGRKGNFNPDSEYCANAVAEYLKQGGEITRLPGPKENHGA
jgi:hypothetical protein